MAVSARAETGPACPHCSAPLFVELMAAGEQRCVACTRRFEAVPFSPPIVRMVVQSVAEAGPDGAVACAQHPGNAAVANCSRCATKSLHSSTVVTFPSTEMIPMRLLTCVATKTKPSSSS